MTLFVTVITYDLREIFLRAFRFCIVRYFIILTSKSIRAGILSFAFLISKPLFELFMSFFGGFRIVGGIICRLKVLGLWLRFFDFRIFYSSALNLYFGCVSGTITLLSLLIYLFNVENRLKACFSLNFDRFLDQLFLGV